MRDLVIVSSGGNAGWMFSIRNVSVTLCSPGGSGQDGQRRCDKRNPLSRNAQATLSFIVQNYDSLPDRVAFVHGHEPAWHTPQNFSRQVAKALHHDRRPFVHLGAPRVARAFDMTSWCTDLWQPIFGVCPHVLSTYKGMEFIADGALLRQVSLERWKHLERVAYGDTHIVEFARTRGGRVSRANGGGHPDYSRMCSFLDLTIHLILGQPETLWKHKPCFDKLEYSEDASVDEHGVDCGMRQKVTRK